ncbi:TPA: hypothetical protein ACGXNJ_000812 [Bacillus cereus]
MATTKQVADFYGVPVATLRVITKRNKDELISDGYTLKHGRTIVNSLSDKMKLREIQTKIGKYIVITEDGNEYSFANRENALFPKRAILRVGMLLRDSEVAKEVRTQLLNIEENTTTEIKTYEIDHEQELHTKLGRAIANTSKESN